MNYRIPQRTPVFSGSGSSWYRASDLQYPRGGREAFCYRQGLDCLELLEIRGWGNLPVLEFQNWPKKALDKYLPRATLLTTAISRSVCVIALEVFLGITA